MIKLFNMDCMEAMKDMPDKAYDLAIVDPPYGDGSGARPAIINKAMKEVSK